MTTAITERRKSRTGRVVTDKMDKTVIIAVDRRVRHRLYGKVLKRVSKLVAHDEANECHIGDIVRVVETRPLSKTKRWRIVEVIRRAETLEVQVDAAAVADQPEEVASPEPAVAAPEKAPEAEPEIEEAVAEAEEAPDEAPVAEAEEAVAEAEEGASEAEKPASPRKKRATTTKPRATKASAKASADDAASEGDGEAASEGDGESRK
jgi:small subunit ribosomal protein S17